VFSRAAAGIQLDQLVQLVQFVVLKKRIGLPRLTVDVVDTVR